MRSCWWLIADILLLLVICEACSRRPDRQLVIIPQPPVCSVNVVQGDSLVPLGTLDFPRYTFTPRDTLWVDARTQYDNGLARAYDGIVTSESGWIASIVENDKAIGVARVDDAGRLVPHPDLAVPTGFRIHALALADEVLFVGGQSEKECAGYYNLADAVPFWRGLDVPDSIKGHGKAIDGFFVSGHQLTAVDDVATPKWFILYNVSDLGAPTLTRMCELRTLGLEPPIVKTVKTRDWLITFSSSVRRSSGSQSVAVYDALSRELLVNLDNPYAGGHGRVFSQSEIDKRRVWNSIAIYGDWLLFAGDTLGIGRIDIVSALDSAGESRIIECLPKYVLPADLSGKRALNVVPLEAVRMITVLAESEGRLEACVMRESDLLK